MRFVFSYSLRFDIVISYSLRFEIVICTPSETGNVGVHATCTSIPLGYTLNKFIIHEIAPPSTDYVDLPLNNKIVKFIIKLYCKMQKFLREKWHAKFNVNRKICYHPLHIAEALYNKGEQTGLQHVLFDDHCNSFTALCEFSTGI